MTFNPIYTKPPSGLTGSKLKNNFGTFYEFYNLIQWTRSPAEGISGYRIYKNGKLLTTVSSSTFKYEQHNQPRNEKATYSVSAVNRYGVESPWISVSIP